MMKFLVQLTYRPGIKGLPSRTSITLYAADSFSAAQGASDLVGRSAKLVCVESVESVTVEER